MAWFPGAIRKVVTRHRTPMARYQGVCNHVAVSEAPSLFGYFNQPGNPTSHFYVRKDGTVEQYVDTQFRAPANLEGNSTLISIETQGGVHNANTEPWTEAQVQSLAKIHAWANRVHGIPLVLMTNSCANGVGYHRLGVDPYRADGCPKWSQSYGKICPGAGKIAQIPRIISLAKGGEEEDMPTTEEIVTAIMEHEVLIPGSTTKKKVRQVLGEASLANDTFAAINNLAERFNEGGAVETQLDTIQAAASRPFPTSPSAVAIAAAVVAQLPNSGLDAAMIKSAMTEVMNTTKLTAP